MSHRSLLNMLTFLFGVTNVGFAGYGIATDNTSYILFNGFVGCLCLVLWRAA